MWFECGTLRFFARDPVHHDTSNLIQNNYCILNQLLAFENAKKFKKLIIIVHVWRYSLFLGLNPWTFWVAIRDISTRTLKNARNISRNNSKNNSRIKMIYRHELDTDTLTSRLTVWWKSWKNLIIYLYIALYKWISCCDLIRKSMGVTFVFKTAKLRYNHKILSCNIKNNALTSIEYFTKML